MESGWNNIKSVLGNFKSDDQDDLESVLSNSSSTDEDDKDTKKAKEFHQSIAKKDHQKTIKLLSQDKDETLVVCPLKDQRTIYQIYGFGEGRKPCMLPLYGAAFAGTAVV